MALGKKNKVSICPENYTHVIIGEEKTGKTTLVADIAKEYYGNIEALLCISVGKEKGHKAIEGLVYEEPQTWKEFVSIVDELIKNPDENEFKIVSIDTIDELVRLATQEVFRLSKIETGKECKSINAAFSGYNAGRDRLKDIIGEQLNRLENSRYGMYYIGHTKIKNMKEKNGDEYVTLTSNLEDAIYKIFSYNSHFICNITNERVVNKSGLLESTMRYMNFRDNGYVKAGGRFAYFEEKYEFGAKNYINAILEALKYATGKTFTDAELKKQQKSELKEKETQAKIFAEQEGNVSEDDILERIEIIKKDFTNLTQDKKVLVKDFLEKYGYKNFTELQSKATLEQVTELEEMLK